MVCNRSAALADLGKHQDCLGDLAYALHLGHYPPNLMHKLWLRQAKCYELLNDPPNAIKACQRLLRTEEYERLGEAKKWVIKDKIRDMEIRGTGKSKKKTKKEEDAISTELYVEFAYSEETGRYARAARDIEPGTIILRDRPHMAVVHQKSALTHCQFCARPSLNPVPCPGCVEIVFCSLGCLTSGLGSFHRHECGWHADLFGLTVSINTLMALRIVTQRPLGYFLDRRPALRDDFGGADVVDESGRFRYGPSDYEWVYRLCIHTEMEKWGGFFNYAMVSVFLLR